MLNWSAVSDNEVMSSIRMRGVHKRYGDNAVLDGLDLEVATGEVFALLGPNGAGKTTAVEILEGYRRADSGQITVLGCDPSDADRDFLARIGIVLQQTTSFEMFTVRETVEMFASLFPSPYEGDEVIELVGLSPQRDQLAETMSGGQRRRLDVACGLVGRPELLFLDEPSTGLDPQARRAMWDLIRSLRSQGTTVLLTTHYLDEAEVLADRIGILINGSLQTVGPPDSIGERESAPALVEFVAPSGFDRAVAADSAGVGSDLVQIETREPGRLVAELVTKYGELRRLTISRPTLEDTYLEMVERAGVLT